MTSSQCADCQQPWGHQWHHDRKEKKYHEFHAPSGGSDDARYMTLAMCQTCGKPYAPRKGHDCQPAPTAEAAARDWMDKHVFRFSVATYDEAHAELAQAFRAYASQQRNAVAVLREVEWAGTYAEHYTDGEGGDSVTTHSICPICQWFKIDPDEYGCLTGWGCGQDREQHGHAPDCRLAAALAGDE